MLTESLTGQGNQFWLPLRLSATKTSTRASQRNQVSPTRFPEPAFPPRGHCLGYLLSFFQVSHGGSCLAEPRWANPQNPPHPCVQIPVGKTSELLSGHFKQFFKEKLKKTRKYSIAEKGTKESQTRPVSLMFLCQISKETVKRMIFESLMENSNNH